MAASDNKTNSTDTVTVGCKLPHGIHLDIYNAQGETAEQRAEILERVTLTGQNGTEIIGGHGITSGVPKGHFEEWMRRNKNHPAVKAGLIFAHDSAAKTVAEASEKKDTVNGFERMDQSKLPAGIERAPENNNRND